MKQPKVLSLFSGVGGLDYGFEAAGFRIISCMDSDENSCASLRLNREWYVLHAKIEDVNSLELFDHSHVTVEKVDMLIGGPPCQPFSMAGQWVNGSTQNLRDPRARTIEEMLRVIKDLQPTCFLIENVQGLATRDNSEGMSFLERSIDLINEEIGTNYVLRSKILDAARFGVPQHRKRLFIVAHVEGREFWFPNPTHGEPGIDQLSLEEDLLPYITAWDAMGEMPLIREENLNNGGKWADLLPSIPEGENYQWHTRKGGGLPIFGYRTRFWSFLLKLAKNRPSWTIPAQPGSATGPFHWSNRKLSIEEIKRLQTFPEDIQLFGSDSSIRRQLGNAVPSLFAEVLARDIGKQFFGMIYEGKPILSIDKKSTCPDPEFVEKVPVKYCALIGEHPDHPGAGCGPGTKSRIV